MTDLIKSAIKLSLIRGSALIALTAFMAGCQHSPQLHMSQQADSSECSSNPYLMRYDCSIKRIQHAAENGNADAQYALGYMYYYGIDTTQDRQTAGLWIQRSAAQGQPLAKKAWSLINSSASFSDLHKAAADQVGQVSRASSTIVQQEPTDVEKLNAATHAEPITNHLPGYHASQALNKSESVLDSSVSSNEASDYTIQLMGSNKLYDLKSFTVKNNLSDAAHYYKTKMNGKSWYMLTYGDYKNQSQAENAMKQLPSAVLAHKPWVKSIATVQAEVRFQKVIA